jgi:uncharacterized protein
VSSPAPADAVVNVDTASGPAAAHVHFAANPRAALILGHGAGGGIAAKDLVAARDVALELDVTVALVEQPYRLAGRRTPPRAPHLDAAWTTIVSRLGASAVAGVPVIVGGRSSGARVACRTAAATGAVGVLCLAFPLQPARRSTGAQAPSRLPELEAVNVPVLVVQGLRDPFGMPPAGPERTVVVVPGDHGLKADIPAVAAGIRGWLSPILDGLR